MGTKENADDDEFEQLENIMKKYSVLQISMGEKLDKSMSVEEESKMIEDKQSIVTELTSVLGDVETIIESMMGKTEEAPVEEQTEEAPVKEQTPEDLAKIMYKLGFSEDKINQVQATLNKDSEQQQHVEKEKEEAYVVEEEEKE